MEICTGTESCEELQKRFDTYSLQDRKRAVAYCKEKDSSKCSSCTAMSNPHHVCMSMILSSGSVRLNGQSMAIKSGYTTKRRILDDSLHL